MITPGQQTAAVPAPDSSPDVVVVGSANVDYVATVVRRPAVGETVAGEDLAVLPGGKGANQAVAAARSGARVAFVGAVGADAHGDMLLDALRGAGVEVSAVRRHPGPSGSALIVVADGDNTIIIIAGANGLVDAAHVDEVLGLISAARVCVLQGELSPGVTAHTASVASRAGVRVVLNLAPVIDLPSTVLALADPLVVNAHEAAHLLGATDVEVEAAPQRTVTRLAEFGPRSVVLTLGSRGSVLLADDEVHTIEATPVTAVDSTGAGDAFVGALAEAIAAGEDLLTAARYASRFAAVAVTRPGAQSSYPQRSEVPSPERNTSRQK